ncbi:hypothetical protein Q1W73_16200 [Asticcacaulis sp. ZE23SCel15]|uniref:hypothetical protein n=1 Tax=Asticcacaulis sp. ZE23SCel15 TaxID=3059027 RepID=UPI00265FAAC0|nr:hypothetical protein [Asticcacaulis sp. ZE23SCel15]WKL57185.1 hypothetical protein Q1W73_16200 [Asticcacaulis sp. ZE23SCel15]
MNFQTRLIATIGAVAMLSASASAFAMEAWDFGALAYGSKITAAPSWAKDYSCDDDGGCAFYDPKGVRYVTWQGDVVVKTFEVSPTNRKSIPFGINYDDSSKAVISTVALKTGKTFQCDTQKENPNIKPGLTYCSTVVTEGEVPTFLTLRFGRDDKLQEIELYTAYL